MTTRNALSYWKLAIERTAAVLEDFCRDILLLCLFLCLLRLLSILLLFLGQRCCGLLAIILEFEY